MIFCFPLPYFPLSTSALFLLSTLVLTLYIDVVLSLSISKEGRQYQASMRQLGFEYHSHSFADMSYIAA